MARLHALPPRVPLLKDRIAPPPKTADPFYLSHEWRALIASIIAERGRICEDPDCDGPHTRGIRVYGDHIIEIKDGGAPLDPNNVLLRCARAHGRKGEAARRARAAGETYGEGGGSKL